ncbi:MAG: virulence protein E [Bacteroidetes bacterium]|nr:MAG: virulence protein E [Bacteroidota bacterium]
MIQFGRNITAPGDRLEKISLERLFAGIQRPKPEFRDRIERLRFVKTLDERRYRDLKKQLPYFVCGLFHPPVRRKENFAAIECFVLDLDHLEKEDRNLETVRAKLQALPEVCLLFQSPGGDGLKVLFRLKERCTDAALFSAFYKLFAARFATAHHLLDALDTRTHDVTRACFLSYDPKAHFRPDALPIDLPAYLPDSDFDKAQKSVKEAEKTLQGAQPAKPAGPDADALERIKERLNPGRRKPKPKDVILSPEVESALEVLTRRLPEFEMELIDSRPINYGRQVRVRAAQLWAEINIFYGKKGYKIVRTTKTGSNRELAELAAEAIGRILDEM